MDDIIYEFVVSFPLSVGYLIMLQIWMNSSVNKP
jgi:hypothetical protein